MQDVTLQVAFNPTTRVARVQSNGAAVPGGSTMVGTFVHQAPMTPEERFTRQRTLFHGVRDVLYTRKPDGTPGGKFPDNITDMEGITIETDVNIPRSDEPEEPVVPTPVSGEGDGGADTMDGSTPPEDTMASGSDTVDNSTPPEDTVAGGSDTVDGSIEAPIQGGV